MYWTHCIFTDPRQTLPRAPRKRCLPCLHYSASAIYQALALYQDNVCFIPVCASLLHHFAAGRLSTSGQKSRAVDKWSEKKRRQPVCGSGKLHQPTAPALKNGETGRCLDTQLAKLPSHDSRIGAEVGLMALRAISLSTTGEMHCAMSFIPCGLGCSPST